MTAATDLLITYEAHFGGMKYEVIDAADAEGWLADPSPSDAVAVPLTSYPGDWRLGSRIERVREAYAAVEAAKQDLFAMHAALADANLTVQPGDIVYTDGDWDSVDSVTDGHVVCENPYVSGTAVAALRLVGPARGFWLGVDGYATGNHWAIPDD